MEVAASPHSFLIPLFSLPPSFRRRCSEGGGSWLSKRDEVVGSTVFPVIPLLTSFLDRKRKRFLACVRNDGMGKRYSRIASFLTRKGFVCRHWPKQVILLLIRNKKRALPSGDALFDLLCLSKVLVSNAQDRSFGQVPPSLYPYTSSASSRIRARLFSQPRQGSVMDLP